MKKYFKFFLVLLFLGLLTSFTVSNFLHYKMEKELYTYLFLNEKMKNLDDTYTLCHGLLSSNPSNINIQSCNIVLEKIQKQAEIIEEKCPYISFYATYINEIK